MLYWAATFLVFSIIAGIFGFGQNAGDASEFAQVLFALTFVLFALSVILRGRNRVL